MAHNLLKPIYVKSAVANVDALYGPWSSIEEACENIPISRRRRGLTIAVETESSFDEYQWKLGVTDEDLVEKISKEVPMIAYYGNSTVKAKLGDTIRFSIKFTSPTYGQCTITVRDSNGNTVKSIKTDKGIIDINLGEAISEGTFTYTVTGIDALSIPAEDALTFTVIIGGVNISCDFGNRLKNGVNTSTTLETILSASSADITKTIKVKGELHDSSGNIVGNEFYLAGNNPNHSISGVTWTIGQISQWGSYILCLWAYTGTSKDDTSEEELSNYIEYNFSLLNDDDFELTSSIDELNSNTNSTVTIPFVIESGGIYTILRAKGFLYNAVEENGTWVKTGNAIAGYELDRSNLLINNTNYWSLGKITTEGDYVAELYAVTVAGNSSSIAHDNKIIHIHIDRYETDYSVETLGLIAEFTAEGHSNNRDIDKQGIWTNNVQGNNIHFELHNLNYNTNGWKHVDESLSDSDEGEMMLKFTGESYGVLKNGNNNYNPLSMINSYESGFTAEIIYRSRCIGELNSKAMTCHYGSDTNSAGFSASYDTVSIGSSASQIRYEVSEDEWIHATMVIDKLAHTNVSDIQDFAPKPLITVYINGSMCTSIVLTDQMRFENIQDMLLLNSAYNVTSNQIDFFGQCEIKAIRFYNRALYSHEVVRNYIASIYGEENKAARDGRNGDVLPIVQFINMNSAYPATNKELKKGVQLVDFAQLNTLTVKSLQKLRYVHAKILYKEPGHNDVTWNYCVVQTQGTSSLAYPVKNYKITLYKDTTFDAKDKTNAFSSLGWQKENKFTLKCDYMEAAHLNNTPSCIFYNEMIDDMIDSETSISGRIANGWTGEPFEEGSTYDYTADHRTPSRRDGMFDAVKGFPCVVEYFESEYDYANNRGVYVGTYMFNLDKSAKSLGFEAPAIRGTNGTDVIQIQNPRANPDLYDAYDSNETYDEGDKVKYNNVAYIAAEDDITGAWDVSKWEAIPEYVDQICQSFEGVANKSNSAGCFYSFEDYKASAYRDDYCQTEYLVFLDQHPSSTLTLDEFIETYAGQSVSYAVDSNNNDKYLLDSESYEIPYANEYEYYAADYEARFDWDDLEEGGAEFWGDSNWGLKRMIDWVSSASNDLDTFRTEFSQYFDLDYCIIYYLQMIVFGQVDNAGKNSMWDTWDGLIWRPRPYDLDTATGLDNSGFEAIGTDAELIRDLSPFVNRVNVGVGGFSEDISATANSRYAAYNTRTSKFWIAFATAFKSQIENMYGALRSSGIYGMDYITNKFIGNTSDIIGEDYYNRDMTTKFYNLSGDIDTYITRMHGNRVQKFKSWMRKRLIFCDTLFAYKNDTDSLNGDIILRSDAYTSGSPVSVYLSIQSYSPQYVKVDVGSTRDAVLEAYCSPSSEYLDPNTGTVQPGVLFRLPLISGNKEIQISGAGNIRLIGNLQGIKASSLDLGAATKLTNLDLSGSTKLVALSLSKNKYLQSLNCEGCVQLGTDASGAQLDISNCLNLKTVNVDNTKLTSIAFPIGGSLKTVSAKRTNITGIKLDSCQFLNDIDVTNCERILTYEIDNCPSITSINADYLPITMFKVIDCDNITSISLVGCNSIASGNLIISGCPNISTLNFSNNSCPALNVLNLVAIGGLTNLNISGSQSINTIIFSSNIGEEFTNFNLSNSSIMNICYDTLATGIDMSRLIGLTSLTFDSCSKVEHIFGLSYTGSCVNLFRNCYKLQDVVGTIEATGSAASMFIQCNSLTSISNATLRFSACTSLNSAFSYCYALPLSEIKYMFDSCSNNLKSIDSICYGKYNANYSTSEYTTLPANFFGNLKGVTSAGTSLWSSGIGGSIPANAFTDSNGANGLQSLTSGSLMFGNNSRITSIPSNIMSYMPALKNANRMFGSCTNLAFTVPSTFFNGATNLETIRYMFGDDPNVVVNMNNMASLLTPLTKLTDAAFLFYNCAKVTGSVPEGFFASNTLLKTISSCFRKTKVSGLPSGSLLRANGDSVSVMNSLTDASGLFAECTTLSGIVPSNLLAGGSNITTIGATAESIPGSSSTTTYGIFEGCTGIDKFGADFFNQMPNLTNISRVFKGCTAITGVPTTVAEPNSFPGTILNTHTKLTTAAECFSGCTNLVVNTMPNLFESSKSTITSLSHLFYNCTKVNGFNNALLNNMPKLTTVANIFYNGTGLSFDVSELNAFNGDIRLQTTAGAFRNCTGISGIVPATLFDSCRNTLTDVSYMFSGCYNAETSSGITGIASGDRDINPSTGQLGLLAECINLITAAYMFNECRFISGRVPWDLFWTSNIEREYSKLENISYMFYNSGFNAPTPVDGTDWLIHPEFFAKLSKVSDISFMFGKDYSRDTSNVYPNWASGTYYPIQQQSFYNMYNLTNIRGMFKKCHGLGGDIKQSWFINSIGTITDARDLFAQTSIESIDQTFLRVDNDSKNNKLMYVAHMLYGCNRITSNLPPMYNTNAYSRIDRSNMTDGYYAFCYNCTSAPNYSAFVNTADGANWVHSDSY